LWSKYFRKGWCHGGDLYHHTKRVRMKVGW
jgi:hypothetical protein